VGDLRIAGMTAVSIGGGVREISVTLTGVDLLGDVIRVADKP